MDGAAPPRLDETAVAERLSRELPHWSFDGACLRRTIRTLDWKSSMLAAGAIGFLAEAAWHHPDLSISFGRLEISLSTHDSGGVTERDLALAAQIEALLTERGAASGPFERNPSDPIRPDAPVDRSS